MRTRRMVLRMAAGGATAAAVTAWPRPAQVLTSELFAFDNGTGRDQKVPLEQQADLVKRCGYSGIGYTGTERIPELLAALDARRLKMVSFYVHSFVDGRSPAFDPGIPRAVEQLRGRGAMVLLTVQGKAETDDRAVGILRDVADAAAAGGLAVCLYPHYGFFVARPEEGLRVIDKAGRDNVGVAFNLCHWLRSGDEPNLKMRLRQVLPRLKMVSVNGADHTGDWDRLIQTLDRGEYDLAAFLRALNEVGYGGPVGLQCYQVKGDLEENLARSMAAWRKLRAGV